MSQTFRNKPKILLNNEAKRLIPEDKDRLEVDRIECQQAVETSLLSYLMNLGSKLNKNNFERLSRE